jgi:hypothetical protein
MNKVKNSLILVLTGLLIASLSIQSAESAPKYATSADLKKVVLVMAQELSKKDRQIKELWDCVNSLELEQGGDGRQTYCP